MTIARKVSPDEATFSFRIAPPNASEPNAPRLPTVDDETYFSMVKELALNGTPAEKKASIYTLQLFPGVGITTLNDAKSREVSKRLDPSQGIRLAFDANLFNPEDTLEVRDRFLKSLAEHMDPIDVKTQGKINRGDLEVHMDMALEGMWTLDEKTFKRDYKLGDDGLSANVTPGTQRVVLPIPDDMGWQCQWGQYDGRKGGHLAMDPRQLPEMRKAILAVEHGVSTIEDAFFLTDKDGKRTAKYDTYVMDPGFFDMSYAKADLIPELQAERSLLRQDMANAHSSSQETLSQKFGFAHDNSWGHARTEELQAFSKAMGGLDLTMLKRDKDTGGVVLASGEREYRGQKSVLGEIILLPANEKQDSANVLSFLVRDPAHTGTHGLLRLASSVDAQGHRSYAAAFNGERYDGNRDDRGLTPYVPREWHDVNIPSSGLGSALSGFLRTAHIESTPESWVVGQENRKQRMNFTPMGSH